MDLIIGGAYQGKTEFAKEKYGLSDKDIFKVLYSNLADYILKFM